MVSKLDMKKEKHLAGRGGWPPFVHDVLELLCPAVIPALSGEYDASVLAIFEDTKRLLRLSSTRTGRNSANQTLAGAFESF